MALRYVPALARIHTREGAFGCRWCGTAWGQPSRSGECERTTCLACKTPQCMGHGLGRGTCGVCFVGLLPGWSGNNDRPCGYKGCGEKAVALAPRMGAVCASHAARAKHDKRRTVAEYIQHNVAALRDSDVLKGGSARFGSAGWRLWIAIDDALPPSYVNAGSWYEHNPKGNAPEVQP